MFERIGRYEIKGELGRGGMATVYRGYDPISEREVAVKILPREFLDDPSFRTRFEREAKTIASLEHPAILPVYDFGEQDGQPYFVMRMMTGGTLAHQLRAGALSVEQTVRILNHIAPGLDYAHERGVVHRDLKPANILFDNNGNPCIADFGIAKLRQQISSMTGSGIIGTPSYMSPEQARGEADIDARSDIYALGTIVYEMLTGQQPFDAETPVAVVMKHINAPVPQLHDTNPNLPASCQELIETAMAKERAERFGAATLIAQRLEAISRGEALPAYVPQRDNPTQARKIITGDTQPREPKTEAHKTHEGPVAATSPEREEEVSEATALTSFKCPNCSAPIDIPLGLSSTKCVYCGASIIIPKELRTRLESEAPRKVRKRGGTAPAVPEPEPVKPPPPPDLPRYGKPLLGAEAIATLLLSMLSCLALIVFAGLVRSVELNRLGVLAIASEIKQTVAAPTSSAATGATVFPAATFVSPSLAAPADTPLLLDGSKLFTDPQALGFDGSGNFYLSDGKSVQIFKFDAKGALLMQWKVETKGNYGARSLAADRFGNVHVVQDGVLLKYSGVSGILQNKLTDANGAGYLDIATFPDGSYAVTTNHDEVVRYNANAQVMFRIAKAISSQSNKEENLLRVGTEATGSMYVAGGTTPLVVKYTADGKFALKFGGEGAGAGQFQSITGLVVDNRQRIYVSDLKGIQVFEADGKFVTLIRFSGGVISNLALNDKGELYGTVGSKVYKFNTPK